MAGGRPKGSENKVNDAIRAQFRLLLDRQVPKISGWIDRIAEDDPAKAIDNLAKLAEFVLPKLARTEVENSGEMNLKHSGVSFTIKAND